MPVHIYGGNGDGKLFINKFLHYGTILLLSICLVSRPPVAESILGNKRYFARDAEELTKLTEVIHTVA